MLFTKLCVIALFVAAMFLLSACSSYEENSPDLIRPISAQMDTARVDRGDVAGISWRPGLVRLRSEGLYFSRPIGVFGEFYVLPGEEVTAGQLLARLDTEALEERIARQEEELQQMRGDHALRHQIGQVNIDTMEINYARQRTAAAGTFDYAAHTQAEAFGLEVERAILALAHERQRNSLSERQAENRLQRDREQLSEAELRAPHDGVITYLTIIGGGDFVAANRHLVYIGDPETLYVEAYGFSPEPFDFPMPTAMEYWKPILAIQAERIHGHTTKGMFELEYVHLTLAERRAHGSSPFPVRFTVVGDEKPALGSFVGVRFYTAWAENVLRIPSNAVFQSPGMLFHAYKIIDGRLEQVMLEVGARTDIFTEIISGLQEGDEVFVRP